MSAFIVPKQSIDAIVTYLTSARRFDRLPTWNAAHEDELGQLLWNLNHAAVDARYGRGRDIPLYTWTHRSLELTPLYKSVCCFIYQCTEGDIPETPTYKRLISLRHELADAIISSSKAYQLAPWC